MDTVLQVADSVARLEHGRITESGRIVDLLRNPESSLGRSLRPARAAADAAPGAGTWFMSYTEATVPADWLLRLASGLDASVAILGASIETVAGATVGHATLGITPSDPHRVLAAARSLGLDARPVGPDPAQSAVRVAAPVLESVA
jgi:ABC-type methionine transport system ATPase subunit